MEIKMVINDCYGGLCFSEEIFKELDIHYNGLGFLYNEHFGINSDNSEEFRSNDRLIKAIEKLGLEKSAAKDGSKLKLVTICFDYEIKSYDGREEVVGHCYTENLDDVKN